MKAAHNWKRILLGNVCKITTGKKDVNQGNSEGEFPFFTCSRWHTYSDNYSFDTEAILIAGNGEVGNLHYYKGKFEAYQRTYVLDRFTVDIHYIFQYIDAFLKSTLLRNYVGSTIPFIKLSDLTNFEIHIPVDKQEQTRIAAILSTIDKAIAQTEAIIAKQQRIKTGLMQDLLTRGIDEHGAIRSEATHAFKDSPLGRIPVEWEVIQLGSVSNISSGITLGRVYSGPNTIELPYLRVANVQDGYLDLTDIKTIRIPQQDVPKYLLKVGDVLMNEGGDFDKLGRGTVWRGELKVCIHQNHVFKVRPNEEKLNSDYLAVVSASPYGKTFFVLSSKQSTNLASINSTQLKAFPIPLPPKAEQERIQDAINSQNQKYDKEIEYREKLYRIKTGLMQDLLTGKVRVTELLNSSPHG